MMGSEVQRGGTLAPVSWPRMIRGVEKVRDRLLRAARALNDHRVPYAVVGENAVAAWVSRVDEAAVRNTRDVGILLRRADLERAKKALEEAGFVHRRIAMLEKAGSIDVFLDGAEANARDAVHVVFAGEKVGAGSVAASPDVDEAEQTEQFRLVTLGRIGADETCRFPGQRPDAHS